MDRLSAPVLGVDLQARGLKPVSELAARRDHGDRLRYLAGCRCEACRAANSRYECERQRLRKAGDWNGIVSAEPARSHMLQLRKQGIGRRSIAAASDVGETVLQDIASGRKTQIRARTARKVLAVTAAAAADHALISAKPTWRLIAQLLDEGYTKRALAEKLGQKNGGLQLGRRQITVRNAYDVEQLHRRLMS